MKKSMALCLCFIFILLILTSCRSEQEVVNMGVNAEILEIYEDEKAFLVQGLDENSILGDKSYVSTEEAYYIEVIDEKAIDITFGDFSVGDKITVDVVNVAESYPTQTSTDRVQLIHRAKPTYNKIKEY